MRSSIPRGEPRMQLLLFSEWTAASLHGDLELDGTHSEGIRMRAASQARLEIRSIRVNR